VAGNGARVAPLYFLSDAEELLDANQQALLADAAGAIQELVNTFGRDVEYCHRENGKWSLIP
jgi:hypothetical protein